MAETETPTKELREVINTVREVTPKSVQVCCCVLPTLIVLCILVPLTIALFRWALS